MEYCCKGMQSSVVRGEFIYDPAENWFACYTKGDTEVPGIQVMVYCPHCGTKLHCLTIEYYDTVEKMLGEEAVPKGWGAECRKHLPPEFQTDEWWRKRGVKKGYLEAIYDPIRFEENIEIIDGERVLKV
jgi:rubredoxin